RDHGSDLHGVGPVGDLQHAESDTAMSEHERQEGAEPMHTGLVAPQGRWWVPAHKSEKVWFAIAFAWCMVLFAMMPLWHWKGGQNASGIRSRVEAADFKTRVDQFV